MLDSLLGLQLGVDLGRSGSCNISLYSQSCPKSPPLMTHRGNSYHTGSSSGIRRGGLRGTGAGAACFSTERTASASRFGLSRGRGARTTIKSRRPARFRLGLIEARAFGTAVVVGHDEIVAQVKKDDRRSERVVNGKRADALQGQANQVG